jgi:ATP/maltotriose-dependent transcriptional regulator MalT
MFWPESSQPRAYASLRRALASLNSRLPGWIEADRETISLKTTRRLWIDAAAFSGLLARVKEHCQAGKEVCSECRAALEAARRLYEGDFLEGLNLEDAPQFDEWQRFRRDELRRELAEVLERLAGAYARNAAWDQAIDAALRWVALDPLDETACCVLMSLYARSGKRTAALHQYEELQRLLREQHGGEVAAETRRLYEEIRGSRTDQSSFPILKTKLYVPIASASRVERVDLVDKLRQVEQHALTLVSAPAGFGKTTLLAEWIAQSPLPVAWLSVDNGDNDPYRFLTYLIAALEGIREGTGAEAKRLMQSPQPLPWQAILASLINDLGKIGQSYAVVLDDYQFLTEHTVHEAVS